MCARKIVNCFCLHSYNRRSFISRFLRGWQLKSSCRSGRESSEGKSIFNTGQPRSNFILSINNTRLLTAGCYKSDLRLLKHLYRLLCPGVVKSILVEVGYMRLFHTPRTSFLLTTSFENTILARVLFLFQERTCESTLYSLFEFVSASLSVKVPHEAGQECFVFLQSVEMTTQKSSFVQFGPQKHYLIQVQNSKPPNELNF